MVVHLRSKRLLGLVLVGTADETVVYAVVGKNGLDGGFGRELLELHDGSLFVVICRIRCSCGTVNRLARASLRDCVEGGELHDGSLERVFMTRLGGEECLVSEKTQLTR